MSEEKSFLDKLFGWGRKKEETKKEPEKKPIPKNEFAEDEKTIDGVVRLLKSDLEKDAKHKEKK